MRAPWLTDRGINAKVLLSAVRYDLGGAENTLGSHSHEFDYLKELCGCLLTFANDMEDVERMETTYPFTNAEYEYLDAQDGETPSRESPTARDDVFVSLAHYTVLEFLESPSIVQTSASNFALTAEIIDTEFTTSVLRQAINACPEKMEADWMNDREAYCLTLACALPDNVFSNKPNVQELFIEYFDPARPHYRRIHAIQKNTFLGNDWSFRGFYINHLPIQVQEISRSRQPVGQAATLLNILLIAGYELAETFMLGKDLKETFSIKLSTTWICEKGAASSRIIRSETLEGTVMEIIKQRPFAPFSHLYNHSDSIESVSMPSNQLSYWLHNNR